MAGISTVVGHFVLDKMISGRSSLTGKDKGQHVLVAFVGLFVVVTFVFLMVALYNMLTREFANDIAALITAGASLGIAAMIALCAYFLKNSRRSKLERVSHDLKSQLEAALKSLEGDWETPIRDNPKVSVALAALAGYILADRII